MASGKRTSGKFQAAYTSLTTQHSEYSHIEHSKVRRSNPRGSGTMRAKSMGDEQFGQRGRSIRGG
jgi:hypothetical protein